MYTDVNNALTARVPQANNARSESASSASPAKVVALKPQTEAADTEQLSESDRSELKTAVDNINQQLQTIRRELRFSVDDDTGRTIVKVINAETDEVVRQIPSDELLNAVRHMQQQGLLLDTEA